MILREEFDDVISLGEFCYANHEDKGYKCNYTLDVSFLQYGKLQQRYIQLLSLKGTMK